MYCSHVFIKTELIVLFVIIVSFFILAFLVFFVFRERSLHNKKEQLNIFMNSISDFAYIKDVKSRFVVANKRNSDVFGLKKEELIGKTDMDLYPPELAQKYFNDEQKILSTGEPLVGVIEKGLDENGNEVDISTTKYPIFNKKEEIVGIVGIGRDITGLIRYEKQLEDLNHQLKKTVAAKDKLISIIAHDLKNPFNVLKGYANLIAMRYSELSSDKMERYINQISLSCNSYNHLLDNILRWSISQREGFRCKPQDLILEESINEHLLQLDLEAKNKKINVNYIHEAHESLILNIDAGMFDTIIRNILSNAIKYTPRGGNVTIKLKDLGENVEIRIADTGIGMGQEQVDMIFKNEKPESSDGTDGEQGTGFGLSLSLEFLELIKGKLRIEKNIPHGSVFILEFPQMSRC